MIPFTPFPKIARYSRDVIVTEKIDGTNAQIYIDETGKIISAGSRTRWITVHEDNFGFARWVEDNKEELLKLGPGSHFGEWWGRGIQRGYGLTERRFSLFNTYRWGGLWRPTCCGVVPVLYEGPMDKCDLAHLTIQLSMNGSVAAPGFMEPEGVILFHTASSSFFKKTCKKDEKPKGEIQNERRTG